MRRREFVARAAACGGTLWLASSLPRPLALEAARRTSERLVLSEEEWKLVEAITGRIIPTDEDPGAIEAGCVNFIDKALAYEEAELLPLYRTGLAAVRRLARQRFDRSFGDLSPHRQDRLLADLEAGSVPDWPPDQASPQDFFQILVVHTVIGLLADPSYGGNREYAGWRLIGYPGPRHEFGGYTPDQMVGRTAIQTVWGEEID